mgnify:CR=1 FL=1
MWLPVPRIVGIANVEEKHSFRVKRALYFGGEVTATLKTSLGKVFSIAAELPCINPAT